VPRGHVGGCICAVYDRRFRRYEGSTSNKSANLAAPTSLLGREVSKLPTSSAGYCSQRLPTSLRACTKSARRLNVSEATRSASGLLDGMSSARLDDSSTMQLDIVWYAYHIEPDSGPQSKRSSSNWQIPAVPQTPDIWYNNRFVG
jgi:hypothetical protein